MNHDFRHLQGCPDAKDAVTCKRETNMSMGAKNFENPDWRPLERLIGERSEQFMWMWREGQVQVYKHIRTRRYLLVDGEGKCYQRTAAGLEPADLKQQLKRVFE